ncbi:hypothetical protein FRB94_013248 [Tulasnella sp. JGI-2019a]|nr:hypothetical protein FRB94_013248 [Tulasnella sp. JGI-2019a]KAG9021439.1 hypothetical protein FRB95_002128 [Tulasnella sp. JGI-2019a]
MLLQEEVASNCHLQQYMIQKLEAPTEVELNHLFHPEILSEGPVSITFESDTQYTDYKLNPCIRELLKHLLDNLEVLAEETILSQIISALPLRKYLPKDWARMTKN